MHKTEALSYKFYYRTERSPLSSGTCKLRFTHDATSELKQS